MKKKRAVTGITPSGIPHIGNYVGMIRPALSLVEEYDTYYFISDYHALSKSKDPNELANLTDGVAAIWLAMGLDPSQTVIYRQSDILETFELAWILGSITPKGQMNRAHAYKAAVADAEAEGRTDVDAGINIGTYCYPILMSADILQFSADVVPVGKDQAQHVEVTRDLAGKFNHIYGETLKVPALQINPAVATILGNDGRKMSKSYDNTLPLLSERDVIHTFFRRYKTDSTGANEPKEAEGSGLFQIYRGIVAADEARKVKESLEAGTMSWGQLKELVSETVDVLVAEPRRRYEELMADRAQIHRILVAGAERARPEVQSLMKRVRRAIGRQEFSVSVA
ncbi:MAG TPA: tryptophan--tRNA ligase [Candidatus Baltobacteraceae bacterium]|nr:tryptophan--tRNA ligase [Candidatus Baltobacteraceae bacterium]